MDRPIAVAAFIPVRARLGALASADGLFVAAVSISTAAARLTDAWGCDHG